jgi:hypothetical protein
VADGESLAYVQVNRDPVAPVPPDEGLEEAWIFERQRAQDDAIRARGERLIERILGADPAADLQPGRGAERAADPSDCIGLAALPCSRAVEVDDVDPLGARGPKPAGHGSGAIRIDPLSIEVPFRQADNLSGPEVDRRNDAKPR